MSHLNPQIHPATIMIGEYMNPFTLVNILLHVGAGLPSIQKEIQQALSENWNQGFVQDALQGFDVLKQTIETVASQQSPVDVLAPVTVTPPSATVATPPATIATPPATVSASTEPPEVQAARDILAAHEAAIASA